MYLQPTKNGAKGVRLHSVPQKATACKRLNVTKQCFVYASIHSSAVANGQPATAELKSKLLEIERLPFPKFTITNSGMADLIPNPKQFDKDVLGSRLSITPIELRKLVNQFVETNRGSSSIAENMEIWRRDVLVAFRGNFSEITLAASMFAKTSRNKTLTCALYKVAAEEGYQNAAYNYALLVGTKELKVTGGNALSKKIIEELAQLDHIPSMLALSDIKIRSKNSNDMKEAVRILEKAAELKNGHAYYRLGHIYSNGLLVKHDYKKAIEWYGKLEELGSPDGYYLIGCMLLEGKGSADGKPDLKAAFESFEKAAAKGSVISQYELGMRYTDGIDVAKDTDLGLEYLILAAEGEMVMAMIKLSILYMEGTDIPKNYKQAREYLDKATKCAGTHKEVNATIQKVRTELDKLDNEPKDESRCIVIASTEFQQTYFVQNKHYRNGGPVLLYGVGERMATISDIENGWIDTLARETHGLIVLIELRFYGNSVPKMADGDNNNDNGNSTADILQFLTVKQMMADTRRFIKHVQLPDVLQHKEYTRARNGDTPWVLVGGSFAGSLMAWTKQQYSDINAFVVASSAPMVVKDGYWEFDQMASWRLPCAHNLSLAVQQLDDELDKGDNKTFATIKRRFGLENIPSINLFVSALAIQVSLLIQAPARQQTLDQINGFCDHLAANSLVHVTRSFSQRHRILPQTGCPKGDDRSWFWQQCLELGMWQTAPLPADRVHFNSRLRSRRLTTEYFHTQCAECFPMSRNRWAAAQKQAFRAFAQHALESFAGNINASDMLFTVGELDPWRFLTLDTQLPISGTPHVIVIPGASHVEDLLGPLDNDDVDGIGSGERPEIQSARSII
ncbi:hypothetical protein IW140_002005 [Coemansia sp. RSA 1813]|nr:hypothetical protein IW138_006282 [Coemansia sp. RSA 986]KAJ2570818.1 hypothetical protein IW140_002005 [Coemansia sp. RSA 1813]